MAYRDLTNAYLTRRSFYVKPHSNGDIDLSSFGGDSSHSGADDIKTHLAKNAQDYESGPSGNLASMLEQPEWVQRLGYVRDDMNSIKKKIKALDELHKEHCTPRFGKDFIAEERQIEILTEEIKRLFGECKKNIEVIVIPEQFSSPDDVMKKNSKMSLVIELNDLSKAFRAGQRDYLQKLKTLKSRRKELTPMEDPDDLEPEERAKIEELEQKMYDPGFTEDQVRELIENEKDIMKRDKEIREIVKSIVELQDLFKEFGELVIQQGTLLDRIDYNLEQTIEYVETANEELQQTEQIMKYSRVTICLLIIVVVFVGVLLLVGIRLALRLNGIRILNIKPG